MKCQQCFHLYSTKESLRRHRCKSKGEVIHAVIASKDELIQEPIEETTINQIMDCAIVAHEISACMEIEQDWNIVEESELIQDPRAEKGELIQERNLDVGEPFQGHEKAIGDIKTLDNDTRIIKKDACKVEISKESENHLKVLQALHSKGRRRIYN